jgi:hypothetical protein
MLLLTFYGKFLFAIMAASKLSTGKFFPTFKLGETAACYE